MGGKERGVVYLNEFYLALDPREAHETMWDGDEPVLGVVHIGPQRHEGNRSFFDLSYSHLEAVIDDV